MSTPPQPPPSGWQVTGSAERTKIAPDGTPVEGIQVSYQTAAGGSGTVFVAKSMATPDVIRSMIDQAAAATNAINSLTSGS